MWKWLLRRFGLVSRTEAFEGDYEPVYGYPRGQVEAWLARNPQLLPEYEARSCGLALGSHNRSSRAGCFGGLASSPRTKPLQGSTEHGRLEVYWWESEWDPLAPLAGERRQWQGYLTTDDDAGRYDLPVLVREDGVALGAADLPRGTVLFRMHAQPQRLGGAGRLTDKDARLLDERQVADPSVDNTARLREVAELIQGAMDASYRLGP